MRDEANRDNPNVGIKETSLNGRMTMWMQWIFLARSLNTKDLFLGVEDMTEIAHQLENFGRRNVTCC